MARNVLPSLHFYPPLPPTFRGGDPKMLVRRPSPNRLLHHLLQLLLQRLHPWEEEGGVANWQCLISSALTLQ